MSIATAVVKGGFFETNNASPLASMSGENGLRRIVRMRMNEKGLMGLREAWYVLTGAAPGATATKNYTVVGAREELGGVRPIDTQAIINRATTAADVTELQTEFLRYTIKNTFGANPPPNLDRNPLGTR